MISKPLAAAFVLGVGLIGWTAVVSLGIVGPPPAAPDGGAVVRGSSDLAAPPVTGEREPPMETVPPSELEAFEQAPDSLPESPSAPQEVAEESAELELIRLRTRVRELEARCALLPDGQIGFWARSVNPARVPPQETLYAMALAIQDYPVELQPEEGLWIAERFRLNDWVPGWGTSVDDALVGLLGPERIALECSPEQLAVLRERFADEGYFAP